MTLTCVFVATSPLETTQAQDRFNLLTNDAKDPKPVRWRHFPVDVAVYPETSTDLEASSAQALVSDAFADWADEGCYETSANVTTTDGTGWASGNGRNEVAWEVGEASNFDKYRQSLGTKQVGEPCESYGDCASGFCDGTCLQAGPTPEGGACTLSEECATLFCFQSVCKASSVTLGITLLIYSLVTEPYSLIEADIVLNETEGGIDFATDTSTARSVVAHEVGHFLGLAHYDVEGPQAALMYSAPTVATIQESDRMGLCAQYPAGAPLCDSDCDCFRGDGCAPNPSNGSPGYQPEHPDIPGAQSCPRSELCIDSQCREVTLAAEGELCAVNGSMACAGDSACRPTATTEARCEGGTTQDGRMVMGPPAEVRGACSASCGRDADCGAGGSCVQGECDFPDTGPDGAACAAPEDCESGQCTGGYCGAPCTHDCDCGALGQRCDTDKGVCIDGRTSCYRACVDPPECTEFADVLDRRFTGNSCRIDPFNGQTWIFALGLGFLFVQRRGRL